MDLTVQFGTRLRGRLRVPGDKSISNRALILAALADGVSRIEGLLQSDDTEATRRCLTAMGVDFEVSTDGTDIVVQGVGQHGLQEPPVPLDCGSSGTTMRLLAGLCVGQPFLSILTGTAQLSRRPMERVTEPLRTLGGTVLGRDGGRLPPLAIQGGNLRGLDYMLPVASAQVKSAILLAGLYADGPTIVREPAPCRDHTERMLRAMGAELDAADGVITLAHAPASLRPFTDGLRVPGDFSSASFFLAAACIVPDADLTIEGVGVNPTRTGLLDALETMGVEITHGSVQEVAGEPVADLHVAEAGGLRGIMLGGDLVPRMIDEFPILAVVATQVGGETVVRDAVELRVKESDRVATVVAELRRMGADIEARPDGFVVKGPTRLRGATVDAHGDHRLAMALAVAALVADGPVTIRGAECVGKSYPAFFEALRTFGASVIEGDAP